MCGGGGFRLMVVSLVLDEVTAVVNWYKRLTLTFNSDINKFGKSILK